MILIRFPKKVKYIKEGIEQSFGSLLLVRLLNPKSLDPLCTDFEHIYLRPQKTLKNEDSKKQKL